MQTKLCVFTIIIIIIYFEIKVKLMRNLNIQDTRKNEKMYKVIIPYVLHI